MQIILLLILSVASVFCIASEPDCEIAKVLILNQEVQFPPNCTLQKLKLENKKFSIVPFKQPPTEIDNGHRLIGLNKEGLILNVTADGVVYWAMKTEPWKEENSVRSFETLMKNEFGKTPNHKKVKEEKAK